jgi:hypothetical protein
VLVVPVHHAAPVADVSECDHSESANSVVLPQRRCDLVLGPVEEREHRVEHLERIHARRFLIVAELSVGVPRNNKIVSLARMKLGVPHIIIIRI